jgi:molybdenum cofactor guanylyltransferase
MSEPVSALVLAGGKSRRLGVDKALISLGGSEESLLASAVITLRKVADEVVVVIGKGERPEVGARLVRDVYPGKGSLGGVYSGLLACRYEYGVVVACDMPFLNVELLSYMVSLPRDYDVLIPRLGNVLEPLHAIYAKACLPYMKDLLDRDHLKIIDFFDKVRVRYVEATEIDKLDPRRLSFFNVNTPEQLAKARAIAEESAPRES